MPNREDASARFKRVATKRLERVLKELKLLGKCGDRHNYNYSKEQYEKVKVSLEANVRDTLNKFIFKEELNIKL